MEKAPANMLKKYVENQHFESTAEVMTAMKEMFADVLQQVMRCELDAQLGYEKSERVSDPAAETAEKNYRNGYSKKTVNTQLGEVELKIPETEMANMSLKSSASTAAMRTAWRRRSSACTPAV